MSFGAPASFPAGGPPAAVAVGDFNTDSRLDLATANDYSDSVSILLGNGSGGFSAPANIAVTETPYSIAAGRFNTDVHLDLATANLDSDDVSILLGNGSGGFGTPTTYAAGSGPVSVTTGNFDGDSNRDLATANYRSFTSDVSILHGDGSGGFGAPASFSAFSEPYSVAAGNFDADASADLAVANIGPNHKVSVLLGNGSGGFTGPTTFDAGANPAAVAVGNFNADSSADLAVANSGAGNVSILLGNGSGGFGLPSNFTAGAIPDSVAISDFNGDTYSDLAVANYYSNDVSILLGNGSGGFNAPVNLGVGNNPTSVVVGDFNGDSRPDFATANLNSINSNDVTVRLNTTSNGYARPKVASPARFPLVPAYNECTSPNRVHGPPDFPGNASDPDGSCNPPARSSGNLTVGTSDANGAAANSTGLVSLRTLAGTPGGPDDSDVEIKLNMTDVRCETGVSSCGPANAAGGADYTGEVQARLDLRITDRNNGVAAGGGAEAGTGDKTLEVTVPCGATPTPDTIGSTCELTTTADAVYGDPSAAKEGKRAVWQLGRATLYDGGADGDVETPAGNSLFAVQGLFAP